MGIIEKFNRARNAFFGRLRIGGLQSVLISNLKKSGVDSPRSKQLISQIALTAWNMHVISKFFQNLGFSFEDYEIMYHAAVIACPNKLIQEKNLVATFLMIDNFHKFGQGLHAISQAISRTAGYERTKELSKLITLTVNDIARFYSRNGNQQ